MFYCVRWLVGCRDKANCPHVEPGPLGGNALRGGLSNSIVLETISVILIFIKIIETNAIHMMPGTLTRNVSLLSN